MVQLLQKPDAAEGDETAPLIDHENSVHASPHLNGVAVVHDKYKLVYWIFFIYGIAMLLPWNVFITASEYFAKRFSGTMYEETFQNYFSTYFTNTNLLTFIFILYIQNKSGFQLNSFISVFLNTVVFGVLAVTAETPAVAKGNGYFWFIMVLIVLTGATTSFYQSSVFSEAGRLPPVYMQAVLSGQGVAGVIVAISSILSALAGHTAAGTTSSKANDSSVNRSAFLYFLSAFIITLAALVGRVIVVKLPFYQYYMSASKLDDEDTIDTNTAEQNQERGYNNDRLLSSSSSDNSDDPSTSSLWSVICKLRGFIFTVGYIFIITLMLFPSLTSLIKSVHREDTITNRRQRFFDDDVFVAFHFLLFNVGDWVGRLLPLWKYFTITQVHWLATLSGLRTVFIPLFLVCNVVVTEQRKLPVLIHSDFVYFFLMWVFSVTNGWICSLAMMAAPQLKSIQTTREKSMVGTIMSFSLVVGLAMGGALSFLVRSLV